MKIALSIWKDCISTVFDSADQLLIFEPDGTGGCKRTTIKLISTDVQGRASEMKERHIDVLICGAISRPLENLLGSLGMRVFAFVRGSVEDVWTAYQNNRLEQAIFSLPGCRGRWAGAGRNRMRGSRCPWR
ncbi:MAG: NifB/NifX family molybdenum-iron cluster-binding protein [Syntrophaceae bacterium]|nr:NifB/NifX family molybdenum-iron cluster-binding protein [Syntrophaceae bacterium]